MLCLCFVVVCIEMRAFRLPGKSGVSEIGKAKSEDLNLGTHTNIHTKRADTKNKQNID